MSSMEVDGSQQVNGLPASVGPRKSVRFEAASASAQVTVVSKNIEMRPKHKARRRARQPKLAETEPAEVEASAKPLSPSKLKKVSEKDRHSRTGVRGLPKKGGAGGKGTWGGMMELYEEDGHTHDMKDPNYDSEEEVVTYVVSPSNPHMTVEEFRKKGAAIFKEYFEHGDTRDVSASLNECNFHNIRREVVHTLVSLALEESASHKEMASVLISDLYGSNLINSRDVAEGFSILLEELPELSLDTPDAAEVLGNFMARAVADDCLPPAFVTNHTNTSDTQAQAACKRAQLLLSIKHGIARLDNVWGIGGGQRPVMFLISKMNLLLKEYLSSGDKEEAVRCLRELEVPHFHHELVYEAVVLVLEDGQDYCAEKLCSLLDHMASTAILTRDQILQGFLRVFNDMTEIVLDAPNAYHSLSKFVERCLVAGFLTSRIAEQVPQRGRKRFVSEGDGGAIKAPED